MTAIHSTTITLFMYEVSCVSGMRKGSQWLKGQPYLILGRGPWAQKMEIILAGEGNRLTTIQETQPRQNESNVSYVSLLAECMKVSRAGIEWLCVSPGPHVSLMIQAALEANLHVIAKSQWRANCCCCAG